MKGKIALAVVLGLVIVGGILVLQAKSQVEAEYKQNRDPNNPCFISGSTFDSRGQESQCKNYLAQKQQKAQSEMWLKNSLAGKGGTP